MVVELIVSIVCVWVSGLGGVHGGVVVRFLVVSIHPISVHLHDCRCSISEGNSKLSIFTWVEVSFIVCMIIQYPCRSCKCNKKKKKKQGHCTSCKCNTSSSSQCG